MADWKEVERLQADFQIAQATASVSKLSERNCIEILIKLQEMKLLEVIHTIDGKEYLTPDQLSQEIRDELYVHGGHVSLVELQKLLNVDYSHIEAKSNDIVAGNKSIYLVLGQLLDKSFLDHIAEEINDNLQSVGQVTIADLCKTYNLPGEFLVPELVSRLGTIIAGRLDETDKDAIFTEAFIGRHKARIRGVLSGVSRPCALSPILGENKMSSKLFYAIVQELISENRIHGDILGRHSEKAAYIPDVYVQTQNQCVDNFYSQNNYLEYETLVRLDIGDPKAYIRQRFKDVLALTTVCVGPTIIGLVTASLDETIAAGSWIDILPLVPTPFTSGDCEELLRFILKSGDNKKQHGIVVHSNFVCNSFIESCKSFFEPLIRKKAEEIAKKSSVYALTEEEMKFFDHEGEGGKKNEKKDERRKKASEGSGSGGGAGIGAREVKTKGKDKKRLKRQRELEAAKDEKDGSSAQAGFSQEATFIKVGELVEVLRESLPDCPEILLEKIGEKFQRPLTQTCQEMSKSVFQSAVLQQQKEQQSSTHLAKAEKKNRKRYEEEINTIWSNVKLFSDALQHFSGELLVSLEQHLLKTVCTDVVNVLFNMVGSEYLTGLEESSKMTPEMRMKILTRLPEQYHVPLKRLHQTLAGKSGEIFNAALATACSSRVCDVMLKKPDKKRERQLLHGHRLALMQQLEKETEPATALHLTVVIIFQNVTGLLLHTSGKCIPDIISFLGTHLSQGEFAQLLHFQNLVMRRLASVPGSESELEEINRQLPKLRDLVVSTKKRTKTGNE